VKLTKGTVVLVCIGYRHLGNRIGEPEWVGGRVLEDGPDPEDVKNGIKEDGEVDVEVVIDPTLHGRVVDARGNFLIDDQERKAGRIIRSVIPVDPVAVCHNTWKEAPQTPKGAQPRDAALIAREEKMAAAAKKKTEIEQRKADAAKLAASQKAEG